MEESVHPWVILHWTLMARLVQDLETHNSRGRWATEEVVERIRCSAQMPLYFHHKIPSQAFQIPVPEKNIPVEYATKLTKVVDMQRFSDPHGSQVLSSHPPQTIY